MAAATSLSRTTPNDRVQKFDNNGNYLVQFGSLGSGNGTFSSSGIYQIAVDGSGNVFVADYSNSRIEKFDNNGNFLPVSATSAQATASSKSLWRRGGWEWQRLCRGYLATPD